MDNPSDDDWVGVYSPPTNDGYRINPSEHAPIHVLVCSYIIYIYMSSLENLEREKVLGNNKKWDDMVYSVTFESFHKFDPQGFIGLLKPSCSLVREKEEK